MSKSFVTVFNKLHFPVEVSGYTFLPFQEQTIRIEKNSMAFRSIRSNKGLRLGEMNSHTWLLKKQGFPRYDFCMVYDTNSQHKGSAYIRAIEALANPIIKHLPDGGAGFTDRPLPGWNLRFFSEMRINQQGKFPVGPQDIFMSHGIGDKNYWIAEHIAGYKHALVPGPAWEKRIKDGGYEGEIHVVGYTKLDPLFNGEYTRNKYDKPLVVWAPTHGYIHKHKGRSSYPQCLTLINEIPDCYEKKLALHPTSRMSNRGKQDVTMQELLDADVVIADAGSTLYEAWALGKPVIFPDWLCKKDVISNFKNDPGNLERRIYEEGIGYHARDMKHLVKLIEEALTCGMRQPEIDFIEQIFPSELRGVSGKKAAEALIKIREEVLG